MSTKTNKPRREKRKQQAKWAAKRTRRSARRLGDLRAEGADEPVVVELTDFEVTEQRMADPQVERLPRSVQQRLETITTDCVQHGRAGDYLDELEALVERYPHVQRLHNYLSIAYERAGQRARARECVVDMYRRFPDYIFAVSNYARYRLHTGDVEEAGRALDGRFMITQFARGRKLFHITEVITYQGVVAEYLNAIGQTRAARSHYRMLKNLDPHDLMVRQLGRELSFNPAKRLAGRLAKALSERGYGCS